MLHAIACNFIISPSPYFSIVLTFSFVISGACPDVFYRDVKTNEMTLCVTIWTAYSIFKTYTSRFTQQIDQEVIQNKRKLKVKLVNSIYLGQQ